MPTLTPDIAAKINAETDSEFWARTGLPAGTKIAQGDTAHAAVWNAIHARLVDMFQKVGAVVPLLQVDREADARFWANTGYKPGQPLDATNQFDRMWLDAWRQFEQQVAQEVAAGTVRWTYDTPAVADMIAKAHQASAAAAQSIASAQAAKVSGDHAGAQGHLDDAHAAIGAAQVATAAAATAMPPPPAGAHPATAAAAQGTHEVLSFTMNGQGQGQLTGVTGGTAPASVVMPADQVGAVQATLAPTRMAGGDADSGTLPGGRGHNALIIAGVCVAGLGAVALATTLGKKSAGRTMRIARARAR